MKVLNRNWKSKLDKNCEIVNVQWTDNYLIVEYVSNTTEELRNIVARLRNLNNKVVFPESITKDKKNDKVVYKANFIISNFENKLNNVWDFYTIDQTKKEYRLRSYIDFSNKLPYKLLDKLLVLKP